MEVPSVWLDRCRWSVTSFGRWAKKENILVLEARAWLNCVERLCKSVHGTKCRQLVLGRQHLPGLDTVPTTNTLARDMVMVSRWIMSEMNTSDAPSKLQKQQEQQQQSANPINVQTQSGACLPMPVPRVLRMKRTRVLTTMSGQNSKQSALTHSRDDFCWNETVDSRSDNCTGCGDALSKALFGSQADDADHGGMVEMEPNTSLSNETACHRQLLAARMSSKAAAKGRNLLHLGAVGHLTRQNYAASLMNLEHRAKLQGRPVETDGGIDAAMSFGIEAEVTERNPVNSGTRLLSAWIDRFSAYNKSNGRKLPYTRENLQDWPRLSPCRSRIIWVQVWSGIAWHLAELRQPAMEMLVMTALP